MTELLTETLATASEIGGNGVSFKEFLAINPVWDWMWELFKGISPLLVALVTIKLDRKCEKERKREEKIDELKRKRYLELKGDIDKLEEELLELNSLVWDTGKNLLEVMQRNNTKEKNEYMDLYYNTNNTMLAFARKINGYADIKIAVHAEHQFTFLGMFDNITQYANHLIDIYEEFEKEVLVTKPDEINKLLDQIQVKMIKESQTIEDGIIDYCVKLREILRMLDYGEKIKL